MINIIKENFKIKELYIDTNKFNEIAEMFKKELINNKDTFLRLSNIDIKNCNQITNLENILNLLESYKNQNIVKRNKKEITLVSYYGNPYITINLCMQSLLQKRFILATIEDNMISINKLLIDIFNSILTEYKICKMINLFNLVNIKEIEKIENHVNNIICIGNTNTYYKYEKNGIQKLKYIPFKNMAIYCDEEEYLELQSKLYRYAIANRIEVEIYEDDIEEFIECINMDDKLENVVILSKSEKTLKNIENKIKKCKVYINSNPFKNEKFKLLI